MTNKFEFTKAGNMALKRPLDALAVVPEMKRSRQDIILYNNRDKQLLEAVN